MRRTLQYRLAFFQYGDTYSASQDARNMQTVENQLDDLAKIIGDGVLSGWNLSCIGSSPASVRITTGEGFVAGIYSKTLSQKTIVLPNDAEVKVYMQSNAYDPLLTAQGLQLETEGPAEPLEIDPLTNTWKSVTYANYDPPASPTGFKGQSAGFSVIQLFWNPNTEIDLDHYEIQRSIVSSSGPWVDIGSPVTNGSYPDLPYNDTGLSGSTSYWYQIRAVDTGGNASAWVAVTQIDGITAPPIITPVDTTTPGNPSNLKAYAGDGAVSLVFDPSISANVTGYLLSAQKVDLIGVPFDPPITYVESLSETWHLSGLSNFQRYRITAQARNSVGNLSSGISTDITPLSSSAPQEISGLTSTSQSGGVQLDWTASPSSSKAKYLITVYDGDSNRGSKPLDVGLVVQRLLTSYIPLTDVGVGSTTKFVVDKKYTFRIQTSDSQGNISTGIFVKGTIIDDVPPKDPNTLIGEAGDTQIASTWNRSPSEDVADYLFSYSINNKVTWSVDLSVGNVTSYLLTGLTNGIAVYIRVKAVDDAGNESSGLIAGPYTCVTDTIAPDPPTNIRAMVDDEKVTLSWDDSVASDFSFFEVMRTRIVSVSNPNPNSELRIDTSYDANHPLPVQVINVGAATSMVDLKLTNDKSYAYNVRATDTNGNIGEWSETHIGTPTSGINTSSTSIRRLKAPTLVDAVYDTMTQSIKVSWQYWFPSGSNDAFNETTYSDGVATYPSDGPTAFNIYRSATGASVGYELVASQNSSSWEYYDSSGLIDGNDYWYAVSAVREVCDVITETGSTQPADSILLGIVKVSGGVCQSITSSKRIAANLEGTLMEETINRLLVHRHSASPINSASIVASEQVPLIDVLDMKTTCFKTGTIGDDSFTCGTNLSPETSSYYVGLMTSGISVVKKTATANQKTGSLIKDSDGNLVSLPGKGTYTYDYYVNNYKFKEMSYGPRQAYVVDPRSATWNIPYVGDFQVTVNGLAPTVAFTIDRTMNMVVFYESLPSGSVVAMNGLGYNFYVPAKIDYDNRGVRVLVDGSEYRSAKVDYREQVIRFSPPISTASTVTLELEPGVADFGTQTNSRQVNLSPNSITTDVTNLDGKVIQALDGSFQLGDLVFPIDSDGNRISGYTVDYDKQQIILDEAVDPEAVLGIEIINKPEVQDNLKASNIQDGVDGSAFMTGKFLLPQLPNISHEGRMNEPCYPEFVSASTRNHYTYSLEQGLVGNGVTAYSVAFVNYKTLLGTSDGIKRTKYGSIFLGSSDEAVINPQQLASTITFGDDVVSAATTASERGGQLDGQVDIGLKVIDNPSMTFLDDGRILITGGKLGSLYSESTYVYDPTTKTATQVSSMSTARVGHALVRLFNGQVVAIGGQQAYLTCMASATFEALPSYPTDGIIGLYQLSSCELYDPMSDTWTSVATLPSPRSFMGAVVLDSDRILISAGYTYINPNGNVRSGYALQPPSFDSSGNLLTPEQYCDKDIEVVNLSTAYVYSYGSNTWTQTGSLIKSSGAISQCGYYNNQTPYTSFEASRELYSLSDGTWEDAKVLVPPTEVITGVEVAQPIKQFFVDSRGKLFAVGHSKVYVSYNDGETWAESSGLESIGCVHRIAEAGGIMYAATDLGVYVIPASLQDFNSWIQGGLIGAGTTEVFDLLPYSMHYPTGEGILAATEIGVFFSVDVAQTWTQITPNTVSDVRNVESVWTETLFITANDNELWRSDDRGYSWTRIGAYDFISDTSRMLSRGLSELYIGGPTGLYYSSDGTTFALSDFDFNRNSRKNAVQFLEMLGDDVCVGYEKLVYLIGADLTITKIYDAVGTIPTVRVNGADARNAYRYFIPSGEVTFEFKRFAKDTVTVASNYAVFMPEEGPWYSQNADAPIRVFVDGAETSTGNFLWDAWQGKVSFPSALDKFQVVTVSLANIYLNRAGSYFHTELENKMEQEKGLPLSLGRDFACNVLQLGLAMEHNFLERGLDRNQYYCLSTTMVDRSFNSFLQNSDFFIMGRKDFDSFNSTINYQVESEQNSPGYAAMLCHCALAYEQDLIFIGTDSDLYLLDGLPGGVVTPVLLRVEPPAGFLGPIRDLQLLGNDVYVVAKSGIYKLTINARRVSTWTKNQGLGLPDVVYSVGSVDQYIVAATSDGMYYTSSAAVPAYEAWSRASHTDLQKRVELQLLGPASALGCSNGQAYAGIGNEIYRSNDGLLWERIYQFGIEVDSIADPNLITDDERALAAATVISKVLIFENNVYVATKNGLYNDFGSARSQQVKFTLENINGTASASAIRINDVFGFKNGSQTAELFVVSETSYLYNYRSNTGTTTPLTPSDVTGGETTMWFKDLVQGVSAVDRVIVTGSRVPLLFAGNSILFG